jgi:hypothetical protein
VPTPWFTGHKIQAVHYETAYLPFPLVADADEIQNGQMIALFGFELKCKIFVPVP